MYTTVDRRDTESVFLRPSEESSSQLDLYSDSV